MLIPRLPIRKFDENGLFQAVYVNDLQEHLRTFHADISHPHKHDFFITVLFLAGKGTHTIDFTTYSVEANSMFYLRPEQIHHWEFDEPATGWILFHSEDFYSFHVPHFELDNWSFFSPKNATHKLTLTSEQTRSISKHFEQIAAEYKAIQTHSFLKICSHLLLLYIELERIITGILPPESAAKKPYHDHFKNFSKLLELHFREQHSPQFYANSLMITTKHLHRICEMNTGKNPSRLIAERIVLEAKRQLVSESKTVREIALQLGYENPDYFHTIFKKITGITTKQFLLSQ